MSPFSGQTLDEDYGVRDHNDHEPAKEVLQKSLIHLVSHLLDNGSDVNKEDKKGRTALNHAVIQNNDIMVNALLENGADVNKEDKEGITALHHAVNHAVIKNNVMIVNALLENGADINKQNKEGQTALFQAVKQIEHESSESNMVSLLLKKKADPNMSFNGKTPLMEAIAKGSKGVMKQLLLYGANVLTEDAEGRNAYDWAAEARYDYYYKRDMKDILKEFSAKKASLIGLERQVDEDLSMVTAFLEPRCERRIDGLAEMVIAFPSLQALIPQDSGTVEAKPSTSDSDSD